MPLLRGKGTVGKGAWVNPTPRASIFPQPCRLPEQTVCARAVLFINVLFDNMRRVTHRLLTMCLFEPWGKLCREGGHMVGTV